MLEDAKKPAPYPSLSMEVEECVNDRTCACAWDEEGRVIATAAIITLIRIIWTQI
jgi:hypothetical protein